ncbi:MAG: hypothetical protein V4555_16685 [Acidobacteriota bacterium]
MTEMIFNAKEQQNLDSLLSQDSAWSARVEVAARLSDLSRGALRLAPQKGYIPLQPSDGIRRNPRNAVSILGEGVSFVVTDWSVKDEALRIVPNVECGERTQFRTIKKLLFKKLNLQTVEANLAFFTKLVADAQHLITERRTNG